MRRLMSAATLCALLTALATTMAALGQQPASVQPSPRAAPGLSFDMIVADRDGRVPDSLSPADITVSVDGKPRRVLAVTRVSRGPGASTDAAARRARTAGLASFAAEPVRNVILVVDQAGLVRGEERAATASGRALLDRLGMADRLAVVLLPFPSDQMLSLAIEQPVAREMLAKSIGQIDPGLLARPDATALQAAGNPLLSDPDRLREAEPLPVAAPAPALRDADTAPPTGTLRELAGLLEALRTVPGRKVIALFSAGLVNPPPAQVSAVAAAAVAARAAIHVFAMPGPRDDAALNLQLAPLETLARSTGGALVSPGRSPERAITRTVSELASCYVVELEPAVTDADGKRHGLRVEVAGRGLSVRAPAWLMPSAAPEDVPAEAPAAGAGAEAPAARGGTEPRAARPPEAPSAREAELQLAMARLVDYVEAYERQYSGLVAEEEYRQSSRSRNVRLRSDYLLVKPEKSFEWISFRDVYEVDGVAVRDRDDRLRRLFLEPGVGIGVQLQAIRDESARYNVGLVERNINVPLFLLRFLRPENRPRFRFRLAGRHSVAGVEAWRIEFEERVFPTIITDIQGRDVDAKGWFTVDEVTGAIVQTVLRIEENGSTGEIKVSFRHDPALGMWVPAEMTEVYQAMTQRSLSGAPRPETFVEGTAKYANYRRFQVKVDEKVVIPK
jgi:VWFA-related protein